MINVTKTYLPPFDEYATFLKRAWDKAWITNNGELLLELEEKLRSYLGVKHLWFTGNGTIVLQMALKALKVTGEVITTPFSYVATTNAILWEGCKPVFVDINPNDCCIDANKIEGAITEKTQAILATHVYGFACDVEKIGAIAQKHKLKVIYDGAHVFGCFYKGKSLLSYGDISTCSFHATKLFHTVEGGCIVTGDDELARQLMLYRQFGHVHDDYFSIGINGKNSEFHAAMGLALLGHMPDVLEKRKQQWMVYESLLGSMISVPLTDFVYNYSYAPVYFDSEEKVLACMASLKKAGVVPRRYFYPSLNELPYLEYSSCPVSEDISRRVLCLPLYHDLTDDEQKMIAGIVSPFLKK